MKVAGMVRLAEIDQKKLGKDLMKLSISNMVIVLLKYLIFCQIHQIRCYLLKEQYFDTIGDDNRLDKIKLHYLPPRLKEFANLDE